MDIRAVAGEPGQRWVLGDAVGHAALWCVRGAKYRAEIIVDDAQRGRGYGSRLLDHVLTCARAEGARSVQIRPMAGDTYSIAFASRRGFVETMRMHHMKLELAEAKHQGMFELLDKLAGEAIAIVTLADFAARSKDPHTAYVDVIEAARDGWTDPDPDQPGDEPTFIDWSTVVAEREDPRGAKNVIVAEQRGRLVGFQSTFGTGVRPELRGHGIATALKVAAIDAAIGRGETVMTTSCGHPAMRHINEKLGFRETSCEVRMVRRL